jgi:hypothetical protein
VVTIYSVDPYSRAKEKKGKELLCDYIVLGKKTLSDKEQKANLQQALGKSLSTDLAKAAACFWPRHAIRLEHDKSTLTLIICFECSQCRVYLNDNGLINLYLIQAIKSEFDPIYSKHKLPVDEK